MKENQPSSFSNFSVIGLLSATLLSVLLVFAGYSAIAKYSSKEIRDLIPGDIAAEKKYAALKNMPQSERDKLVVREKNVIANNPLDRTALQNMLVLSEIDGDKKAVEDYGALAAARTLQDKRAQGIALQAAANSKNYSDFMYRIDGLLRIDVDERTQYFNVLIAFLSDAKATVALGDKLAEGPPWRTQFIYHAMKNVREPQILYSLLSTLKTAGTPVSDLELQYFIGKLNEERKYELANFIWLDFLSDAELTKTGNVFDSGFDLPLRNLYYSWTFSKVNNMDLAFAPREANSNDKVLQVSFSGGRIKFQNFFQYIRLAPGTYKLSGESKAVDLKTQGGLQWQLHCAGDNSLVVEAGLLSESTDWVNFSKTFELPAENCSTQILRLHTTGVVDLDTEIFGRVFYDNVRIEAAAE